MTRPPKRNQNFLIGLLALLVTAFVGVGYAVWTGIIQPIMKAYREEATKLNAILNSIADGVIVQNTAGEIETMNPSAQKIIDETVESVYPPQKIGEAKQQAQKQAKLSSLLSFLTNLSFYQTDDVEIGSRVLSAQAAPIVNTEEEIGSVVILRDVTAEAEAKRLKDDFITTISHELRTPLSVIKIHNDLLKFSVDHIDEAYRENFERNLENVDANISTLLDLIEQMLDLTQINAGALGIDQEPVDLRAVIRNEAQQWLESMSDKKLTYTLDLPPEAVWVQGDEDRLIRVLHNLLKNSYSYTPPGGQVEVSMQFQPHQVQVDVRDTGVGIAERDKPLIFSRFFRAIHAENTYEIGGAGLGLFLSRAIIEAHGGKIWFESQVNRGSTFSFCLPTVAGNGNHNHRPSPEN